MSEQVRLAVVLLVDEHGRVLLQERDDGAPYGANQWAVPGGHVEAGEAFEDAAYRELLEETGLALDRGHLWLWRDEEYAAQGPAHHWHVYVGRTDGVTDADIVVGEGRQIVYVDPATIADLDTAPNASHFIAEFLDSATYRRLAALTPQRPVTGFSSVVLVDPRGRLLMQERDERPAIDPDCWGFVGGHLDEGEDFETAAYRELEEETGLTRDRLDGPLTLVGVHRFPHDPTASVHEVALWLGRTGVADEDVETNEGRRICFVEPHWLMDQRLTVGAGRLLPVLFESAAYQRTQEGR